MLKPQAQYYDNDKEVDKYLDFTDVNKSSRAYASIIIICQICKKLYLKTGEKKTTLLLPSLGQLSVGTQTKTLNA